MISVHVLTFKVRLHSFNFKYVFLSYHAVMFFLFCIVLLQSLNECYLLFYSLVYLWMFSFLLCCWVQSLDKCSIVFFVVCYNPSAIVLYFVCFRLLCIVAEHDCSIVRLFATTVRGLFFPRSSALFCLPLFDDCSNSLLWSLLQIWTVVLRLCCPASLAYIFVYQYVLVDWIFCQFFLVFLSLFSITFLYCLYCYYTIIGLIHHKLFGILRYWFCSVTLIFWYVIY